MEKKIKKSVAILLAHIIKIDHRDVKKEAPLFCRLMREDFDCDTSEAEIFLTQTLNETYDLDEHITLINDALGNDKVNKMHILEQINHIIYSDTISTIDYDEFEKIKQALLPS
jgi:uncharacterized tellurite resistance protein B-like protein